MTSSGREGLLVILPGGLGDLIQLEEIFREMAAAAQGPVDLLTDESLVALARSWHSFRDVMHVRAELLYGGPPVARVRMLLDLVRRISERRYASCAIFKAHPAFGALAWAARVPERCGFRRGAAPFLTCSLPLEPRVHRVERARRLAGLALGREIPSLPPRRLRARKGRPGARRTLRIGIAPGGARNAKGEMPSRRWPLTHYLESARDLGTRFPEARFFVFGAGADATECDALAAGLPRGRVRNLCDSVPLERLEATLARMDLVITHDSGLMHVAAQSGCALVAIFGPTDPAVVIPEGEGILVLWRPAGPRPCHDEATGTVVCRHRPCCIRRVGSTMVVRIAEEYLAQSRQEGLEMGEDAR